MYTDTRPRRFLALPFILALLLSLAPAPSPAADPILSLRAVAVNMSGVGRARAGTIDIVIERWSTDEEREQLRDVLIEKGGDRLLSALQKIKPRAGYLRTSTSLGWDIQFAREDEFGDGGRRIVFATDRPMNFWELRNQARSSDYEFVLCDIRLTKAGKGTGKLAGAAKIEWKGDTRTVEIENYGIEPVRLTEVQVVGPKGK